MSSQRLKTFPDLAANDFQHPWDLKATKALKAIPGFDFVCAKVMEYGFERAYYLHNTANNVRITAAMLPKLHRVLRWGCQVLDVDEPELYLTLDPRPDAYTYGHTRPFIVVSTGLLETLDERELFFAIAHELGHIKCDHVLYTMVARNISTILGVIGSMTLGLGQLLGTGLELALLDWSRKAELSCDRAGLIAVQDREVAMRAFMKLAGGNRDVGIEMEPHAFLDQIRQFDEGSTSKLDKTYRILLTAFRTHPYPVMRAKMLDDWIERGGYEALTGIHLGEPFPQLPPPAATQ